MSTEPVRPALRVTAATAIADALREEILAMALLPGTPIVERDLTARFGVSRTPLREALIRLGEEGLLDIRPQAGTFVSRIPLGAVAEAMLVRQALEDATVTRATERGRQDGHGIRALREALDRQDSLARLGDARGFHEADEAFHELIAEAAGHPGIWRIVRQAKLQVDRCRRLTLPVPGRMDQVVREHREVVDAVAAGDAPGAVAAMRRHLGVMVPDAAVLAGRYPEYFVR